MAFTDFNAQLQSLNSPGNLNSFGLDRNSKHYAANTQAALLRQNWDYSRGELTPILSRLQYMYMNPQGESEAVQQSSNAATQGFDAGQRATQFNMQRAGLSLTPEAQKSYDQTSSLNRGLASLGAKNVGARQYDDLKQQIATGANGLSAPQTQPKLQFGA